jgi:hypothetical protein
LLAAARSNEKHYAILNMMKLQGGRCHITDMQRAAGVKAADHLARYLKDHALVKHRSRDLYELSPAGYQALLEKRIE